MTDGGNSVTQLLLTVLRTGRHVNGRERVMLPSGPLVSETSSGIGDGS